MRSTLTLTGDATRCPCGGQAEQNPGWGHCIVRCDTCQRDGIRTWSPTTREPRVRWSAPDCAAFGCIGLPRCDYCGELVDSPEARAVLTAAARVRRGDVLGALRLLQGCPPSPEPTGSVGSSNTSHPSRRSG